MSEVISMKTKPAQAYVNQPSPHMKNREDKEQWRNVEIRNKQIKQALQDIKKGPPAAFHAPQVKGSLRDAHKAQQQRDVTAQEDPSLPGYEQMASSSVAAAPSAIATWPLAMSDHNTIIRNRQQREIDAENARIQKKLAEIYQSKRLTTHGQSKGLGPTIDCNDRWTMRTSIYQPVSQASSSNARPNSASMAAGAQQRARQRPSSAPRAASAASQIPKTMGVASCAGCGTKAFHNADGPGLQPCMQCKKVFYCSETCARTDFQSHKALCKYSTTGHWMQAGQRPADDFWVNNAAMAKARRELKARRTANVRMSPEEELEEQARVDRVVQAARAEEKADLARQAKIEQLAYWGMDGPRPCMYMAGKKV